MVLNELYATNLCLRVQVRQKTKGATSEAGPGGKSEANTMQSIFLTSKNGTKRRIKCNKVKDQ